MSIAKIQGIDKSSNMSNMGKSKKSLEFLNEKIKTITQTSYGSSVDEVIFEKF